MVCGRQNCTDRYTAAEKRTGSRWCAGRNQRKTDDTAVSRIQNVCRTLFQGYYFQFDVSPGKLCFQRYNHDIHVRTTQTVH